MNAITLWQPHASLIADGPKRIETRTHNRFRSLAGQRIAIHAAARKLSYAEDRAIWQVLTEIGLCDKVQAIWRHFLNLPRGALLCTVLVARSGTLTRDVEHTRAACCYIDRNIHGLFLEDVRKLDKPIPWKGARGIFNVPDSVIPEYAR